MALPRDNRRSAPPPPRDPYRYVPGPRSFETSRRERRDRFAERDSSGRLLPFALTFFVFLTLIAYNLFELTRESTAVRILEPAVARMTEIDQLLPRHADEMREVARAGDVDEIFIPSYPILLPLEAEQVRLLNDQMLLEEVKAESAQLAYAHGLNVFAEDGSVEGGVFSSGAMLRATLGQLTEGRHTLITWIFVVLLLITLAIAAGQLYVATGWGRIVSLGASIAIAAIFSLLAAFVIRLIIRSMRDGESDPLRADLLTIAERAGSIPLRNYLAVSVFALALIALGWFGAWLDGTLKARLGTAPAGPQGSARPGELEEVEGPRWPLEPEETVPPAFGRSVPRQRPGASPTRRSLPRPPVPPPASQAQRDQYGRKRRPARPDRPARPPEPGRRGIPASPHAGDDTPPPEPEPTSPETTSAEAEHQAEPSSAEAERQ